MVTDPDNPGSELLVRKVEVRSGTGLPRLKAFERWEAQMIETYFPLAVSPPASGSPVASRDFHGRITHGRYGDVDVTAIGATPQRVRLTDKLIAAAEDEYLLASIGAAGRGRLHLDGKVAEIGAGDMVFFGSAQKLEWDFENPWEKTVLQIPLRRLREHSGLTLEDVPLGRTLAHTSSAAVVSRFFLDLARLQRRSPEEAALLAEPALDLLVAAVRVAAGAASPQAADAAFDRQRVLDYMRTHFADPGFTVDRIAQGCMLSRRTLYRIFDRLDEGPAGVLRRMRVDHARGLLANTYLPMSSIALGSGFLSERAFFRTFRELTGMTPGEYRAAFATGAEDTAPH